MNDNFFVQIARELDQIDPGGLIEPPCLPAPMEIIVGEATPYIKKLYTLRARYELIHNLLTRAWWFWSCKEEAEEMLARIREKHSILNDVLWYAINGTFDLRSKGIPAIRQGWKITYTDRGREALENYFPNIPCRQSLLAKSIIYSI